MYALSWVRPQYWADKLGKPPGRTISTYHTGNREHVEVAVAHINMLCPEMDCAIEVFR